ncbi:hypothetical protein ABZ234_08235 [Nocardiopsis sp. NPDC006198]|uniref:hypothetical protein n=1 Tax=Nocardiopsis sp. NPDC006198 TaxID=3154472 RepID=UPI0033B041C7
MQDDPRLTHARLRAVLTNAHPRRAHRTHLETREGETHPAWVFDERALLTAEVNAERTRRGLSTITPEQVQDVEATAVGHIDYASKLTWHLAELACGLDEHHPTHA